MKKILSYFCLLLASAYTASAQTGIGTTEPQRDAVLDLTAQDKALLLSRVATTDAIANPTNGMIVYVIDSDCFKVYQDNTWSGCIYTIPGSVATLSCTGTPHSGTLTSTKPALGVHSVLAYTGGNGMPHDGQTVASTGVTGLYATLGAGNFTNGNGTLTYTITGTPSEAGTATFNISIGGQQCVLTREVRPDGGTITSLDCASAVLHGTLRENTTATGVYFEIPYSGGDTGKYPAQNISATGITGLVATLIESNFTNGNGILIYNVEGSPSGAGTANFYINIGGKNCTFSVTVLPDAGALSALSCASATNTGTLSPGVASAGVSFSVPYTGGNGGNYTAKTITSTGVTGLTATLSAGSFAVGPGSLTFTVTGTPSAEGVASFAINVAGLSCTVTRTVITTLTALNCSTATHNGTLTKGVAASSTTSIVGYTGGTGGTYTAQAITSTGVTGLTATLAQGSFANGSGNLTYTITGTPASAGTASFAITIGGQSCTFTRTVYGSVTALNCSTATHNGTLTQSVAASSITSIVGYTGGTGGTYAAQTITSTGVTGLTATLTAGTFATGTGNLTYTITGTPATYGTASFALNIGGTTCTLTRTIYAAVTALNCSTATHNGNLTQDAAASSITSIVGYTGGTGGTYPAQTIASTGVTGLTATLITGTFATGSGSLTFTITGTPSTGGTASFALNIGGQSCTFTRTIYGSVTALNCSTATHNGNLTQGVAASSTTSVVGYTGGTGSTYPSQSIASTGVTGLTATLTAGTYATGTGNLTFTITGTPASAGTASFALNIGGTTCTLTRTVYGSITALNCSTATLNGTLTQGVAASSTSTIISYTGGTGGTYPAQTIASTGATGLTATLSAGTYASGSGSLTYTITGTPASAGTANFAITIGGQSCTFTRTVYGIITLAQNRTYMVTSVYDQDYWPYTTPVGAATTSTQAANGVNETVAVDVQGSITTAGLAVTIPATATGSGTLPSYSTTITIPASMTQDGISRNLTLSWTAQAYGISTKSINATIKAVGGTLNAKKLDINAGIGNDALGVVIGQFTYPYNNAGTTTTYSVRAIAGIPDKMYGLPDNAGNSTTHNMLYVPIVAEDGNIWLNNNLGADYANMNHASFNPIQQATSESDYLAFGSKFQWGRKPDGHELITYTNATTATPVYGTTSTRSNDPTNALFINPSTLATDWRVTSDDTLWATEASTNNPCPVGFRVPTLTELNTLITAAGISNNATAAGSTLKLSAPGHRYGNTFSLNAGSSNRYWSATPFNDDSGSVKSISSAGISTVQVWRDEANTVRCLKD